jgi:hypothetical protein
MTFIFYSINRDLEAKFIKALHLLEMPFFSNEQSETHIIEVLGTDGLTPRDYFKLAQVSTKLFYGLDPNTFMAGEPHF